MFSPSERSALKRQLVDHALQSAEVVAAARETEDRWSDIDLALRLTPGTDPQQVAAAWTGWVHERAPVVDHLDVWADGALYRVLLLESTLQIDLSFWPDDTFRAHGPDFRMIFGVADPPATPPPGDVRDRLRWGWLHLLHARSALARGRRWQAVAMITSTSSDSLAAAFDRVAQLLADEVREAEPIGSEALLATIAQIRGSL